MVVDVALYTVVHRPRRLKLPAQPVPRCASIEDIARCLFDEHMNERSFHQAAQNCYYPTVQLLLELVRKQHLRLGLGISLSFARQASLWDAPLLALLRELLAEESVELVGVEPYRSVLGLIDLPAFAMRMRWMADEIAHILGKRPLIADISEVGLSASLYNALDAAGFQGIIAEGQPGIMRWRSSNYLYRLETAGDVVEEVDRPAIAQHSGSKRARQALSELLNPEVTTSSPILLLRHAGLSADVSERFASSSWAGFPLYASTYANWIKRAEGDFALLGWDMTVFGERYPRESGIFEFLRTLPQELASQGITTRTPSELLERFADEHCYPLPLPVYPVTWSEPGAEAQQTLFLLMQQAYNLARLTGHAELLDLANWLIQADNLRATQEQPYLPEWLLRSGPLQIAQEQQQVYLNFLGALEPYLPARRQRLVGSPIMDAAGEQEECMVQKKRTTRISKTVSQATEIKISQDA